MTFRIPEQPSLEPTIRHIVDMDEIYPQIEAALPAGITSGKATDPVRIAAKAMLGYIVRELAMQHQGGDYPKPPLKAPKGEDIVLLQLRYLARFLGDMLALSGGLTIECAFTDVDEPELRLIGLEVGSDVGTAVNGHERGAVPPAAGESDDQTAGAPYLPARPLDGRRDDRQWENHLGAQAAAES